MQKSEKNWSVLLWSIFLSLVISVSFISISTKVNKNIKKNSQSINNSYPIEVFNNKIKKNDLIEQRLDNRNIVEFANKNYSWSLSSKEKIDIWFPNDSKFKINVLSGWPIYYETTGSLNSNWVINTSLQTNLSWNIMLENLWWYTRYEIKSNLNFTMPEIWYKIVQKIWNKDIIRNSWFISK